jgi:hypothetical protein
MRYYLDSNYRVHIDQAGDRVPWDDDDGIFVGKSRAHIEGYRVIPDGETWVDPNGMEFAGRMISPAVNYDILQAAQTNFEELSPRIDSASLAASIAFVVMAQNEQIDDVTVTENAGLFAEWVSDAPYAARVITRHGGQVYRCAQAHTSQAGRTPDAAPALWALVGELVRI